MIDFDVQKPIHLLNQVDLEGLYNILTVCVLAKWYGGHCKSRTKYSVEIYINK